MHHSMRFYSRYREWFLRYYIFQAKWTGLPLLGHVVRWVANAYGKRGSGAFFLTLDESCQIVDMAPELALGPCTCREVFKSCDAPKTAEIMVGTAQNVFIERRPDEYRQITSDEAKSILQKCHDQGLVHTIVKCRQDFYAICNCCSCCCVPLRLRSQYGIGSAAQRVDGIVDRFKAQQF